MLLNANLGCLTILSTFKLKLFFLQLSLIIHLIRFSKTTTRTSCIGKPFPKLFFEKNWLCRVMLLGLVAQGLCSEHFQRCMAIIIGATLASAGAKFGNA
jgi:hypothetical protein